MNSAHHLILIGGALGLFSILAGAVSAKLQAPVLLIFLILGMLAGEDGPGRIPFNDFHSSYLIGSIALAVILFEGGFKTERNMIKLALAPSFVLATAGVALTALIVGAATFWLFHIPWTAALLIGAVLAPTDAAAVNTVLRAARVNVPERVTAALELESGLNDPMSVFLTVLLVQGLTTPHGLTFGHSVIVFAEEMGGGALVGIVAGYGLHWMLRRLPVDIYVYPVLALTVTLFVFGGAQTIGASGFLAVYLMGVIVGLYDFDMCRAMVYATETFAFLAQITLFLLLGLLVTPHNLIPWIGSILIVTAVLIFAARPLATFACLLPFRFSLRETTFASWVGLRGAAPIYLTIVPVLAGVHNSEILFGSVFGVVIASLLLQGWTVSPVARLLGFGPRAA